ncbi:MAG: MarR family transcriptional regulator [Dehalobacterium sp.]
MEYDEMLDLIFNNLKSLFYPEEWLDLDLSFSKSELFAMLLVDRYGEIIMSQVADFINVPMSTATGIAERLVKKGYLKRERSESDRRIVVVKLTEKGKDLISELKNTASEYLRLINESLTAEERQVLMKVFLKIVQIVEKKHTVGESEDIAQNQIKHIKID